MSSESTTDNAEQLLRSVTNGRPLQVETTLPADCSLTTNAASAVNPLVSNGPANHNLHSRLLTSAGEQSMITSKVMQINSLDSSMKVKETITSIRSKQRLEIGLIEGKIRDLESLSPLRQQRLLRFDNFGDVPNINTRLALLSPNTKVRTPVSTYHEAKLATLNV